MSNLREAAQQALEALDSDNPDIQLRAAIALRAALEQTEPVQEPVAWMIYTQDGKSAYVTDNPTDIVDAQRALPLYAALEQERAEPVAWYYERDADKGLSFAPDRDPYKGWQPLYTAPPQRTGAKEAKE